MEMIEEIPEKVEAGMSTIGISNAVIVESCVAYRHASQSSWCIVDGIMSYVSCPFALLSSDEIKLTLIALEFRHKP